MCLLVVPVSKKLAQYTATGPTASPSARLVSTLARSTPCPHPRFSFCLITTTISGCTLLAEALGVQGVSLVTDSLLSHTNVVLVVDCRRGSLTLVGVGIQMREGRLRGRAGMKSTGSTFPCLITITELGVEGHGPRTEGLLTILNQCPKLLTIPLVVSQGTYGRTRTTY